ncbi:DUF1127 domain-containing protein [Sulfitobacter sabulilitoris]|uniref:DUF1127 domain-containing protein n=1 Tax=Sulfitobacter sabulilitoris TaxID=2562655 RepID=A0A5S3PDA6_9RHOB|nr:DUF1127 domain-containing protein [Sulfitobacter sabulilitoris]TMM51854.1 DUF1127 domain-containing protein [Sulfitobacter sabulilitoris]
MALLDLFARPTRLVHPAVPALSLSQRLALWRSRRALARLDATALDDIGVTAAQAKAEASRPFWDAPQTWTR